MKILKEGRFIFNYGTKAELEEENLILLKGEIAIENDTQFMKVGDGKSPYSDLPYLNRGPIGLTGDKGEKGDTGTSLSINGTVADEASLPKNPKDGDGYMVQGDLYIAKDGKFTNVGRIKGPQGDTGPQGATGPRGEKGDPLKYSDLTSAQKQEIAGSLAASGVLNDYAKSTEVETKISDSLKSAKLADFESDSSHRTVSDKDKTNWDNKLSSLSGVEAGKTKVSNSSGASVWGSGSRELEYWIGDFDERTKQNKDALNKKVNGVEGKGLSSNDFTDSYKAKVDAIKEQVILTESEYNALTSSQKNDTSKIYFIKA